MNKLQYCQLPGVQLEINAKVLKISFLPIIQTEKIIKIPCLSLYFNYWYALLTWLTVLCHFECVIFHFSRCAWFYFPNHFEWTFLRVLDTKGSRFAQMKVKYFLSGTAQKPWHDALLCRQYMMTGAAGIWPKTTVVENWQKGLWILKKLGPRF